ncbi:glycosyltransferase 87 family protein [Kribbella sp. NBC_01245]|uniref:glycosyltransferase 87 family protein n=1 Tax=Kribbella sp. NBC_01245 TaxID=2903578 RepID=UPI002E28FD09|nr:glycosyltransferase 87 family protein [Kribbella sp. NBC_01245]
MTLLSPSRPPGRSSVGRSMAWPIGLAVAGFLGVCVLLWPPTSLQFDLRVYAAAAGDFLDGASIYEAHLAHPEIGMAFTYPPFAAILFVPLALAGTGAGRIITVLVCGLSTLAIGLVSLRAVRPELTIARLRVLGLAIGAAGIAFEPIRSTFGYGQINLLLTLMLLVDLLGYLPPRYRGVLVGIATGIKLTPGIFLIFLLVTRRYREAATAAVATVATMLIGFIAMPSDSIKFWGQLIFDPGRPGAKHFISNQSLRGVVARITEGSGGALWVLSTLVAAIVGLYAARRAHDAGERFEAILLAAATGLLVSPISWTGHWVWALPICVLLWSRARAKPVIAVLAAVWTITTTLGLPWFAPYFGDREYTHQGFDLFLGNAYPIVAIAFIATAFAIRRRS